MQDVDTSSCDDGQFGESVVSQVPIPHTVDPVSQTHRDLHRTATSTELFTATSTELFTVTVESLYEVTHV